jgi:hypothetical protein
LSYSAWNLRPGSALAARYSACCKARTGSAGTPRPDPFAAGLALTALTGPLLHITRTDEAAALPSPQVVLSCGSTGTTAASDAHPASNPLPGVTGYKTPRSSSRNPQAAGPGRASPVPAATLDAFRAPYAGESFTAALPGSTPLPWPSPRSKGLGTPLLPPSRTGLLTTPQASRHATDRIVAPPYRAFDAGLRPGPFPDQAASLLPGSLAITRTGLSPASGDELTDTTKHHGPRSRCHLPSCWAHWKSALVLTLSADPGNAGRYNLPKPATTPGTRGWRPEGSSLRTTAPPFGRSLSYSVRATNRAPQNVAYPA